MNTTMETFSFKRWAREEGLFILFIAVAVIIMFIDVVLMKKGFLSGDHREQHFSWYYFFASELSQGRLPWWCQYNGCGFPLLAEGQIGAFYPINLLFLLPAIIVPAKYLYSFVYFAYNYEVVLHFILGAGFFYWFARRIEMSSWAALFSTLIYTFGSSICGFFYNVTSQRTIIWFPLTLIVVDSIFRTPRLYKTFLLGIFFAIQLFAGYLQIALYSFAATLFYGLYFLTADWIKGGGFKTALKRFGFVIFSLFLGCVIALPQLLPTFQLSLLSTRVGAQEALAYIGSVSPTALVTLFFPAWDSFARGEIYIGIISIFFLLVLFFSAKKTKHEWFFIVFGILSFLFALGKFSPLYVLFVKITHFYGFRVPAKLLYFTAFSLAALAGFGLDRFLTLQQDIKRNIAKRSLMVFTTLSSFVLLIPLVGHEILKRFKPFIKDKLWGYVSSNIYGKPYHTGSLDAYREKLNSFYRGLVNGISIDNIWTISWMILIVITVLLLWIVIRSVRKAWLSALLVVGIVFCDLFLYSFVNIKGDYETFAFVRPKSKIVDFLNNQEGHFRTYEFHRERNDANKFPTFPNFNILQRLEDIGIYSPLILKDYKDLLGALGSVNDSLEHVTGNESSVKDHLDLLSLLNVKYILSTEPLRRKELDFIIEDKGVYLYENKKCMPRAFFINRYRDTLKEDAITLLKSKGYDPRKELLLNAHYKIAFNIKDSYKFKELDIESYDQQRIEIELDAPSEGFVFISELFYPGWSAKIDGREAPIFRANALFQTVHVNEGTHKIELIYKRFKWKS